MYKEEYLSNNRGSTMIMVLMVMVVLLILGTALMSTSVADNRFAAKNEDRIQAYYIARTGAQAVAEYIIHGEASEIIGKTSEPNTQIGGGSFTVTVEEDADNNVYNIISVGEYNDTTQTAKIRISSTGSGVGGIFQYALVAQSEIEMDNSAGTGLTIVGSAGAKDGPIFLGSKNTSIPQDIESTLIFPPIVTPDSFDLVYTTISNSITIESNAENPLNISVGSIDFSNNNRIINITGDGIVHMYIDGDIDFGADSGFLVADTAKLYVYVTGSRTISLRGVQNANYSKNLMIYAPESDIDFNNASKNFEFEGTIIANNIYLTNHLSIKHNPEMYNFLEVDKTNIGIEYTGYSWYE
jgi:type II secretory pathway pseudopilin PulG